MSERPWEQRPDASGVAQPRFPPPAASTGAAFPANQQQPPPAPPFGQPQPPWQGHVGQPFPPAAAARPNPNWQLSIASLVPFLGLGCGVVAIIFSSQVAGKLQSGDFAGAQSASNNARTWAIIGIVVNVLAILSFVSMSPGY